MSNQPPPPIPPPQPPPYQVPPPSPPLDRKLLWHSILWPPFLAVVGTIILVFNANTNDSEVLGRTLFLCVVLCLPVCVGWGLFIACIKQRYRGFSLVILILAYPFLQAIIILAVLFLGCVTIASRFA